MKLRLCKGRLGKSRDERVVELAQKFKDGFPERYSHSRLASPEKLSNGGLFAFCDDICQVPPALTAPLLGFSDVQLVYWGCNDDRWVRAIVQELETQGILFQRPYYESVNYSAHYHPGRDDKFFSTLDIVYPFYHEMWAICHEEMQQKMRELLLKYRKDGFREDRLHLYSMNIIMLSSSRLYTFHDSNCSILDGRKLESDMKRGSIYMDAPLGFCLSYRSKPNALVSFWPESETHLLIHQIQGISRKVNVHASARGLNDIHWRGLMLEFAAWAGAQAGMKTALLGAENNNWITPAGDFHVDYDRAVEMYNRLAERMGMKKADNGNFYQP